MKIKKHYGDEFYVYELNKDKEIKFNIEGQGEYVTSYLNINEIKVLIKFLEKQVKVYDNDIRRDNS